MLVNFNVCQFVIIELCPQQAFNTVLVQKSSQQATPTGLLLCYFNQMIENECYVLENRCLYYVYGGCEERPV